MYPINAAAVIIEERMHMTGEPYSVLCDSDEMIVAGAPYRRAGRLPLIFSRACFLLVLLIPRYDFFLFFRPGFNVCT